MRGFILSTLIFVISGPTWAALKLNAKSEEGHLEFMAIGRPAMIRIKGESGGPEGSIEIAAEKVTGQFKFSLNSLNTGIDMRDQHMKEKYLETGKNPEASLMIEKMVLTDSVQGKDVPFSGQLKMHGLSKPVTGIASYETKDKNKSTHVEFKIHLSDFGISVPSYAGVTVADEVQIKMDLQLKAE